MPAQDVLPDADWPGNNRIESLRNLVRDERLGMVFLFPGQEIFLRINGRGRISTAPELLAQLSEGEGVPKAATVVAVDQVLLHCGKANRAKLGARRSPQPVLTAASCERTVVEFHAEVGRLRNGEGEDRPHCAASATRSACA